MSKDNIVFIGLDTHKLNTEVAYCLDGREYLPQHLGKIQSTKQAFTKLARQFQSKHPRATLHFVYEAGPCEYWVYRLLTSLGHCCYVVAPSLIPKKAGERIKTDKRDALKLTRLLKNADVDPIYVPEPEDEALRDLSHITKCGNTRARRLLVEGAHAYRYTAKVSEHLQLRQEGLPRKIVDIAWQAQLRLCKRYQKLMHRGKHRNLVVMDIAREMIAYICSISREVSLPAIDPKLRLSRVPKK